MLVQVSCPGRSSVTGINYWPLLVPNYQGSLTGVTDDGRLVVCASKILCLSCTCEVTCTLCIRYDVYTFEVISMAHCVFGVGCFFDIFTFRKKFGNFAFIKNFNCKNGSQRKVKIVQL